MSRFPLLYLSRNVTFAYVTPPRNSYHLLRPFYMPTKDGPQWSIALSDQYGSIFAGGLTLVFALIFSYIWDFIAAIAILFVGDRKLRRYVGLLSVWNAGDPWAAFKHLTKYAYQSFCRDPNDELGSRGWRNFWYGLTVSLIALLVVLGAILVAILVPAVIQNGNAAPVNRNDIFYPEVPEYENYQQILEQFAIMASSGLRALSSATLARDAILDSQRSVTISETNLEPDEISGDPRLGLSYNYSLTGVEFGLQFVPQLQLEIKGACITEYSWLASSTDTNETYYLWNNEDINVTVSLEHSNIGRAPIASFYTRESEEDRFAEEERLGNFSYAIVVGSAHRSSITIGNDPWYYATENRSVDAPPATHNASYWVKTKRPVLSCWQAHIWQYNDTTSHNFRQLRNNTRPHLAKPLRNVLEAALALPMIYSIGIQAGDSALLCRTTSSRGVVDATRCSIRNDMERLILASYVATHHIFTDTTLFTDKGEYPNVFSGSDGILDEGADGFVVRTPNVRTFSLVGIIVVASTLFGMIMLRFLGIWVLWLWNPRNNPWRQMEYLTPRQLFRNLCERQFGKPEKYWPCYSSFPDGEDDRILDLVDWECKKPGCHGHIRHFHENGRFSFGETLPFMKGHSRSKDSGGSEVSLKPHDADDFEMWDLGSNKDDQYGRR
ncbi:hypothetical protein QBC38DRAFT_465689 [Podospora fimiseda]|uniref:Uncharacterized protein n=1 Tax=Podospora fimiseda TaxID=252190 RepID=A0AAN7BXK8_9PEZI|nr:hypothetical protein QBC38DRAFT_465689 [Podospora fimiseda]